jgi:hypothetical protein
VCRKRNDVSDAAFEVRGFVGLWMRGDPLLIDVCVRTKERRDAERSAMTSQRVGHDLWRLSHEQ